MFNFFKNKKIVIITGLIFVFFSRWKLFFSEGIIGHNWDWNIPLLKSANLYSFKLGNYLWDPRGLGISDMFARYWNWYLFGPGVILGGELWSKIILIFILLGAFFNFYLFSYKFLCFFNKSEHKNRNNFFIVSIFAGIYYALNPFVFNDIISGSLPYLLAYSLAPLALYFFLSYIKEGKFFYIILYSFLMFIISGALFPYLFTYFISFILFLFYKEKKIKRIFAIFGLSFLIVPFLFIFFSYGFINIDKNDYHKHLELEAKNYSKQFINTKQSVLYSFTNEGFLNRNMFSYSLSNIEKFLFYISFIFLLLIIFHEAFKRKKINIFIAFVLFLFSISIVSVAKSPLTGGIFLWLMDNFVFFRAIRTTYHLMFLNIFAFLLLSVLILSSTNKKIKKYVFILLIISISPLYFSGDNGKDRLKSLGKDSLDQYTLDENLIFYLSEQSKRKNLDRILYIPVTSSPLYLKTKFQLKGQGGDPDINKMSHSFLFGGNIFDEEIEGNIVIGSLNYNLLTLLNFKNFLIREDVQQNFSIFRNNYDYEKIKNKFKNDTIFTSEFVTYGNFKNFLPHFYTPKKNIVSNKEATDLPEIVSGYDWEIRSAVFFEGQNEGKGEALKYLPATIREARQAGVQNDKSDNEQILEFKKINPTKYRIRVHNAKGQFPLVFSESFHDGWRAYATQAESEKLKVESEELESYKILDGNEGDQATKEELKGFVEEKVVTDLGDREEKEIKHMRWNVDKQKEELDYIEKYNIDFISKNFQDTIQNDNLPEGKIWETWMPASLKVESEKLLSVFENNNIVELPEEDHLMVNGYANSWVIDVDEVCGGLDPRSAGGDDRVEAIEGKSLCIQNEDGSYDMELIVEFRPQRLFYIGLFISGTTLLACFGYLGYDFYRRKRNIRVERNNGKKIEGDDGDNKKD